MIEIEGVHPALLKALNKRGFEELTPVQKIILDPAYQDRDLLVSAQTGSGKTVAFGIAMASTLLAEKEKFARAKAPLALIVAPTRELALQVKRELEWLYEPTGAVVVSCVGGMDIRTERRALERGCHIIVGTPGRLRDHITRSALEPSNLAAVVFDEADEMLDLGFREDLEFILETTPEERRTLLFSATVPPTIGKLAKRYQNDAVHVVTEQEEKQHSDIDYRVLFTAPAERENAIINVLRYYEAKNALVFCNTRASVNRIVSRFNNRGFSVVALSGELTQSERTHALQSMRDGRARVCIATDVAARGIDLPNLELVVHAELPSNPETLVHRSGRTGRAGRKGVSILMSDAKGRSRTERLLRFAEIDAQWSPPPSADDVHERDAQRMLSDPILTAPIDDDERDLVAQLTQQFDHEQIAAAFLRQTRAGKSAPEDIQILDVKTPQKSKKANRKVREEKAKREEFTNSTWISLSVGRKQRAEPRWLIPLLCNTGELTKREIGSIKMQNDETFVQLNADKADGFFDALGNDQVLEKNIRVTRLPGKPKFGASSPPNRSERSSRKPSGKSKKFKGEAKPFKKSKSKPDISANAGKDSKRPKKKNRKKNAGKKKAE